MQIREEDSEGATRLSQTRDNRHGDQSDCKSVHESPVNSVLPTNETYELVRREIHRSQIVKTSLDPVWEESIGPVHLHSVLVQDPSSNDSGGASDKRMHVGDATQLSSDLKESVLDLQLKHSSLYVFFDLYDHNRINYHDYLGSARVSLASLLASQEKNVHLTLPVGAIRDHSWHYDGKGNDYSSKCEDNGATVSVTISLSESGDEALDMNTKPTLGGDFSAFEPPSNSVHLSGAATDANGAPLLLSSPPLDLGPKNVQPEGDNISLPMQAEAKLDIALEADDELTSGGRSTITPLQDEANIYKDEIAEVLDPFLGRGVDIDLHVEVTFSLQGCADLARADTLGSSDPYVTISSIPTTNASLQYYYGSTADPTECVTATESIKAQALGVPVSAQRNVDNEDNPFMRIYPHLWCLLSNQKQ